MMDSNNCNNLRLLLVCLLHTIRKLVYDFIYYKLPSLNKQNNFKNDDYNAVTALIWRVLPNNTNFPIMVALKVKMHFFFFSIIFGSKNKQTYNVVFCAIFSFFIIFSDMRSSIPRINADKK